jgi:hypothetical protein
LTPDWIRAHIDRAGDGDVDRQKDCGGSVVKDRNNVSRDAGKAAERRAFLKRFGGVAAAAPAAVVLLSSKGVMAFGNGNGRRKRGRGDAGFS